MINLFASNCFNSSAVNSLLDVNNLSAVPPFVSTEGTGVTLCPEAVAA